MNTHPAVEDLSTYLDNSLTSEERARVEAHLELCEPCRQRLQAMQEVVRKLAGLERRSPPRSLGRRVKELSALQATRPTLVDRMGSDALRLGLDNVVMPMFGILVALVVIIFLLSWGFSRTSSTVSSPAIDSDRAVPETSLEPSELPAGSGITESRWLAGRAFDLIGDTWVERELDERIEIDRLSAASPEAQRWLEAHPEVQDFAELASAIRLRLDGRVVEMPIGELR
jgi:anti-sigma factor RsiW